MYKLRNFLPPKEIGVVVYHGKCSDGFAGAQRIRAYLKQQYGKAVDDYITFIGISHGDSDNYISQNVFPKLAHQNVVYIDYCPPKHFFIEMVLRLPKRAIVLDHHISALKMVQECFSPLLGKNVYFDMNHSGVILAHQYCFPKVDSPYFSKLIEDRDLFKWSITDSDPFTTVFMRTIPFDFNEYEKFENNLKLVENMVEEGKILLKHEDLDIKNNFVKRAKHTMLCIGGTDYLIAIINTNTYFSKLGNALAKQYSEMHGTYIDFALIWFYDSFNNQLKFSARSDNERSENTLDQRTSPLAADVSKIATSLGGGGHKHAAGFRINLDQDYFTHDQKNVLKLCGYQKK